MHLRKYTTTFRSLELKASSPLKKKVQMAPKKKMDHLPTMGFSGVNSLLICWEVLPILRWCWINFGASAHLDHLIYGAQFSCLRVATIMVWAPWIWMLNRLGCPIINTLPETHSKVRTCQVAPTQKGKDRISNHPFSSSLIDVKYISIPFVSFISHSLKQASTSNTHIPTTNRNPGVPAPLVRSVSTGHCRQRYCYAQWCIQISPWHLKYVP